MPLHLDDVRSDSQDRGGSRTSSRFVLETNKLIPHNNRRNEARSKYFSLSGSCCWWQIKFDITWDGSLCRNLGKIWCLYLPVTSRNRIIILYYYIIFLFMAPYTISSHNFTMQKVWKEASEGVCWVLLCCSSHSLLLPEQLLVELHFELCFGSSADVVFSFELDRFPRLPDLFLSTAMQKAVITPQLVLLLVLRCWEHSWLGGRNLRLSGSLLVQVWKLQYTLPVWMFAHYNKYWMLLIWNLWSHFRNVDVRVRSGCLKDGWGGGKIFTSFQYFLQ